MSDILAGDLATGVRHVVVAVNKMDLREHDAAVFRRIVDDYRRATASLGFVFVTCIPVAARAGENVSRKSQRLPWYDGPALLPYLETVDTAPAAAAMRRFLMPVLRAGHDALWRRHALRNPVIHATQGGSGL